MTATLPWMPMEVPTFDVEGTFGTLYCADGDGFWTVLIVKPGQEQTDIENEDLDQPGAIASDYGFGWSRVGNASQAGAYFFHESCLCGHAHVPEENAAQSLEPDSAFVNMALAMHECRMRVEDPLLFEHLSNEDEGSGQVMRPRNHNGSAGVAS